MGLDQVNAWIQVGEVLIAAGIKTVDTIKGWLGQQEAMTDAALNLILDGIIASAKDDQAQAELEAGKQ